MDRLSNEILICIFKYLHREQKERCMSVCKLWYHILDAGHDIETIVMSSWPSRTMFDHRLASLTTRVFNNSSTGLKCKRLVIDGYLHKEIDRTTFAELFPNLSFLFLSYEKPVPLTNQSTDSSTMIQVDHLQCWRENLVTLIEESYTSSFFGFLNSGVFHRLTTLAVSPSRIHFYKPFIVLCKALKNTPSLQVLSIKGVHTDVFDLEELHSNVPSLTSLILLDSPLRCNHGIPANIEPTERMKVFKMIDSPILFNFSLNAFDYIISKYSHLQEFTFTVDEYYKDLLRDDDSHFKAAFNHLIRNIGSYLTTLQLKLPFKTPIVFDIISQRSLNLNNLSVNTFGAMKTINNILSADCFHHLHTISLFQVPSLKFSKFKRLPDLKVLELEFKKKKKANNTTIELNKMISSLPKKLETLELVNVEIILDGKEHWQTSSLQCLKLKHAYAAKELSDYIEHHFPKLDQLTLHYCHLAPTFELSNHRLLLVDLILLQEPKLKFLGLDSMKDDKRLFTHLVLTVGDKITQYLHQREKKPGLLSLYNSVQHDVHDHSLSQTCRPTVMGQDLPYFHFKCATVQTLYYNGYLVI